MSKVLAFVGALLLLCAYGVYNREILFGSTKPSIAAWALWGFLVLLNAGSYWEMSKDWRKTIFSVAGAVACVATTVVVIAKGGGFGALDRFGWIILVVGVLAGLVWFLFRKAEYANLIVMTAVAISFIPVFQGMHNGTVNEPTPVPWLLWTAGYSVGAAVVVLRWRETRKRNWFEMVYPLGAAILHFPVVVLTM